MTLKIIVPFEELNCFEKGNCDILTGALIICDELVFTSLYAYLLYLCMFANNFVTRVAKMYFVCKNKMHTFLVEHLAILNS